MMNTIDKELKEIEQLEKRLAEKKRLLLEEQKAVEERHQKLESLVESSGYTSPKELVEALVYKYSIRLNTAANGEVTTKRTRTTITSAIRDAIKNDVNAGNSKMAVSKKHGISYVVVGNIMKGNYDHL
jgi:hypothetical protein